MTTFLHRPQHRYEDPLDRVWTLCAERIGFRVKRTPAVYASTDGRGTILIGAPETLDPDDSLAQMILHELCHALIEGAEGEVQPDWGLDNTSNRHRWREHACLRLQATWPAVWDCAIFLHRPRISGSASGRRCRQTRWPHLRPPAAAASRVASRRVSGRGEPRCRVGLRT